MNISPPSSGTTRISETYFKSPSRLFQVFDILWSDPQPADGCIANSLRGAGTYFGPDVTEKFLQKHKLLYLIRSHECKPEGYELTHGSKVGTQSSRGVVQ
jgi:diadenosine tetraphosphatase ApaH/serine/threonine PP2A family protein phosphatase